MCKTSAQARDMLVDALELDLVGPPNGHPFERELLPRSPRTWYLTGMLVPVDAKVDAKEDPASDDEIDAASEDAPTDDGGTPDKASKRRGYLPSSIGLSFLVPPGIESVTVEAQWGEYHYEVDGVNVTQGEPGDDPDPHGEKSAAEQEKRDAGKKRGYRRTPRADSVTVAIGSGVHRSSNLLEVAFPESDGLFAATVVRAFDESHKLGLPAGTRAVSIFLVNRRKPDAEHPYRTSVFQPCLIVTCGGVGFVARPDPRGTDDRGDHDEQVANLQYRDVSEFAVGHGIATHADENVSVCHRVATTWMPRATVERVDPMAIPDVEFNMEALGGLTDANAAGTMLESLVAKYNDWIAANSTAPGLSTARRGVMRDLADDQRAASRRIADGIEVLKNPRALEAFRIANRAMAAQARRRQTFIEGVPIEETRPPTWRPFQLAFILMGLRGIESPTHDERETVDLLFFPTGGGKTEAYLGLAAFTIVYRRLCHDGIASAGVTVLMRYTLRLLTLDQLGRAAALMCALELERSESVGTLGDHPFEIGLWVGSGATPNRMGKAVNGKPAPEGTALARTLEFRRGRTKTSPIPLESCPWCGMKFTKDSFRLEPNLKEPTDLLISCANRHCAFTGDRSLPIVAVDEPLYRRLPCFVISTVDKFAALPWTAEVGQLLGCANRFDNASGFSRDGAGEPVTMLPPDLIIQDELHLISGPLGTIAGIYEGAIDTLATRMVNGVRIRPKIVASTATVRRAHAQIKALFDRKSVLIFPPPGIDRTDSFFARTCPPTETPGRLYVGVAAQGRSLKVVYLRTLIALLAAGEALWTRGTKDARNPLDPYMTLVGYFNSLRELGGSRRIAEDEVALKLRNRPRKRIEPDDQLFASRKIQEDILELTSRVSTDQVAQAKERLGRPFSDEEHVDLALATNMISVGLDISRLGLMVVLGQPKTTSEYIQATSRVGRERSKPGLIVALLNIHKPRDRSHYERFETYHRSFYRSVEATSVTPGSPRALDRALAPALVGLCRHIEPGMNRSTDADAIIDKRSALDIYAMALAQRARSAAVPGDAASEQALYDSVLARGRQLLDWWMNAAIDARSKGLAFTYDARSGSDRLLREVLDLDLAAMAIERRAFQAARSMRDVEPSVDLFVKEIQA